MLSPFRKVTPASALFIVAPRRVNRHLPAIVFLVHTIIAEDVPQGCEVGLSALARPRLAGAHASCPYMGAGRCLKGEINGEILERFEKKTMGTRRVSCQNGTSLRSSRVSPLPILF